MKQIFVTIKDYKQYKYNDNNNNLKLTLTLILTVIMHAFLGITFVLFSQKKSVNH